MLLEECQDDEMTMGKGITPKITQTSSL